MAEKTVDTEQLLHPESTRKLIIEKVTRFNPAFSDCLPFAIGNPGQIDPDLVSTWLRGASRIETKPNSAYFSSESSARALIVPVVFSDDKERTFRCVFINGGGLTEFGSNTDKILAGAKSMSEDSFPGVHSQTNPIGGEFLGNCESSFDTSILFDQLGARVDVPILVAELSKNDFGVAQFLAKNPKFTGLRFGVRVYAMRSPLRMTNLYSPGGKAHFLEHVLEVDAPNLIQEGILDKEAFELAKTPTDKLTIYFKAVSKSCGKSLALIHKAGYWIGNRTLQNTSSTAELADAADGRVTDSKISLTLQRPGLQVFDFIHQANVAYYFANFANINTQTASKQLVFIKEFIKGYKDVNPNVYRFLLKSPRQALTVWLNSIGLPGSFEDHFLEALKSS